MLASAKTIRFDFKFAAGTSRGVLLHKDSTFLVLKEGGKTGIGECSTIPGLSPDDPELFQAMIQKLVDHFNSYGKEADLSELPGLDQFPSIQFGVETALKQLDSENKQMLFDNEFSRGNKGIPINGLVWMGEKAFMEKQILEKLEQGYKCIKLKIGALDFETELAILRSIRNRFSPEEIEIRVDANGAFKPTEAQFKLDKLSEFSIHSIEQPIRQGQWDEMAGLCRNTPIAIALDEELIGVQSVQREELIHAIKPQYIILKPSLLGGFKASESWIRAAEDNQVQWWVTSALESNIGLNAISQWTFRLNNPLPQGLGTGMLYHNNIPSPLEIRDARLWYNQNTNWNFDQLTD